MRRFGVVLFALLVTLGGVGCGGENELPSNDRLLGAFLEGRTGVWVSGHGTVIRPLGSDQTSQRFLVRVNEDLSLVIRHRIGSAGQVPADRDDVIAFQGRYEFHGGGGEIIMTHADAGQPGGGGWIEFNEQRYQ